MLLRVIEKPDSTSITIGVPNIATTAIKEHIIKVKDSGGFRVGRSVSFGSVEELNSFVTGKLK